MEKLISLHRSFVFMTVVSAGYIGNHFAEPHRFIRGDAASSLLDDSPILTKQLDENTVTKIEPFYLPPASESDSLNETEYSELKEINVFKHKGFGPNGENDLFLKFANTSTGFISDPVDSVVENCKANQLLRPVCASNGKMYRNLGHLLCAQREIEDLQVVWDGPCNRNEWPMASVSANGTKIKILNPEIVIKYIRTMNKVWE